MIDATFDQRRKIRDKSILQTFDAIMKQGHMRAKMKHAAQALNIKFEDINSGK